MPENLIDVIRRALRGEPSVTAGESLEICRSLPHGHVAAVLGTLRQIGLEHVIGSRGSPERNLVVAMIVARILDPRSKLATARGLNSETAFFSLGEQLRVESVDEEELYGAMDWVGKRQGRIEAQLAKQHLEEGTLVLYDVTSSSYTGTQCPLAKFGHDRDGKKGFPQINYGLLCTKDGCPVAVEVFEGNVGDPKTLGVQIKKIRERFGLQRVVLVGDRGLITDARIREELKDVEGLDWITALRAPAIQKLVEQGVIQTSLFDERDLAEVSSPDYPDERLVVCRNPLLADERRRKREALLQATEKELDTIVAATQRTRRPLRGKAAIGLRVGKVKNHFKMGKHLEVTITEESFSYTRDTEKIQKEAALDGFYVIRTSVAEDTFSAEATVHRYKDLSRVERAFRCLKTVDLKVRPIHHRLADRVRAHIFLCMLAYYVEWHMREALAPILFDDDEKECAQRMRESIVAPAQRSPRALRKATTKRTDQGEPVHSFQTLLQDLATITKNRVRPQGVKSVEFDLVVTTPTAHQRRAFELLGVPLSL